ncbi:MAG: hypothetical protein FJ292_10220 [Planctomycetes bacterium]|nr:hypothetical protein [Planctomycetota bacterium]
MLETLPVIDRILSREGFEGMESSLARIQSSDPHAFMSDNKCVVPLNFPLEMHSWGLSQPIQNHQKSEGIRLNSVHRGSPFRCHNQKHRLHLRVLLAAPWNGAKLHLPV